MAASKTPFLTAELGLAAALAAGAQAYRLFGPGPRAEAAAVAASRRLVQSFGASNQQINCLELTDTDMQQTAGVLKYLFKGGPISCGRMAVRFSPLALNEINAALAEDPATVPASCASCAATTARQMGASELHAVMAAGLAGGIGLSGGCCGALGAAIWITGINHPEEKIGLSADDTRVGELLEAFVASADHRFECAEIVGRRFAGVNDHARYLRGGGCSELIRTMALTSNPDGHGRSDQLLA